MANWRAGALLTPHCGMPSFPCFTHKMYSVSRYTGQLFSYTAALKPHPRPLQILCNVHITIVTISCNGGRISSRRRRGAFWPCRYRRGFLPCSPKTESLFQRLLISQRTHLLEEKK